MSLEGKRVIFLILAQSRQKFKLAWIDSKNSKIFSKAESSPIRKIVHTSKNVFEGLIGIEAAKSSISFLFRPDLSRKVVPLWYYLIKTVLIRKFTTNLIELSMFRFTAHFNEN